MAKKKVIQEVLEETMQETVENTVNKVVDEAVTEETVETPTLLTLDEFKEKLTIKKRASVVEQQMLVQTVYDSCVKKDEENGIYYIDYIMLQVAYNFSVLQYYTDYYEVVEGSDNYTYEYLDEIGVFNYVAENIDVGVVRAMIEGFELRVANLNSVGSFVYRLLGDFTKKMPDIKDLNKIIKNIPKALNSIDKDTISIFAKELGNGNLLGNLQKQENANLKVVNIDKK